MHYQRPPHAEAKLIRCTMGALFDVIVDVRPGSKTRKQWAGFELTADNRRMLYAPEGVAHGFITLAENTEVFYQMSESFHPECAASVRWDDPAFGIEWPLRPAVISDRDRHAVAFAA
jgi:dTDP-4-dehydrorhamnose 3,5-epimerase